MGKITAKVAPFIWEGIDKQGGHLKGELSSTTIAVVKAELRRQGISPVKVKRKPKAIFTKRKKRITSGDISIISRQLATMLTAGIPLVQSFDIVARGSENPGLQALLHTIKIEVESGTPLSAALAKHPLYFDNLYCSLIEAGEHSGSMELMLSRVATYKEKIESRI